MHRTISSLLPLVLTLALAGSCFAQSSQEQNEQSLRKYFQPKVVTELDWELMYFNIHWKGAYGGTGEYLVSFPVTWDASSGRFRALFRVKERRSYGDTRPFFSMSKPEMEVILQDSITSFTKMLSQFFPEVSNNPKLIYIEFMITLDTGAFSNVAVYKNGRLAFSE